jgi:hypothetical protein
LFRLNKTLITIIITSIVFLSTPSIYTEENFTAAWKDYAQNPNRHSNIPNNSFAGYQYGEKPIPHYPIVVNAHDFGAVGDGKTESAKAINEAIKAAYQKGGGAVLLPAGVYLLGDEIWMNYDGVVLRGEGLGKTILKIEKNLTETFQGSSKASKDDKSDWEEAGGFIWFTPETETSIENVKLLWKQGKSDLVTSDATIGEDKLTVGNGSSFSVSDKIIIMYLDDPSETYQKEILRELSQ